MKSLKRNQYKWNNQDGFTLVELIVASAISILVLGMVAQIFTQQREAFTNQTNMAKMVANGRGAVEFVTRAIQNAGYHVIRGGKILSGGDHYITTVSDLDDDGVVESGEVLTYILSSVGGANNRTISFPAYFDMNGDGLLHSSETNTFTVNYSMTGPPFNLLQFNPKSDGTVESFVVAENIDNLVFRFYGPSGDEMGVNAVDGSVPTQTGGINDLPLRIEAANLPRIRTVDMQYMVRTKDEDENAHYLNTGTYIAGSAALQSTPTPQASTGGYTDSYRRRVMTAQASPRNLGLAPFGRITIQPSLNPITCPATSTPFTLTAVDSAGSPIDSWDVNLRVSDPATISLSSNSLTTDSQGEATGAISYDWSVPSFTTTLSADAQWTDLDGTLRSVITSVSMAFVSPAGAGVFDNFDDGDSVGWAEVNPSEWEVENNEYKLVDAPSGTVNAISPAFQGEATAGTTMTNPFAYTVPAGAGSRVKLVVGVGAEATLSGGTPTVLNSREFRNTCCSSQSFTTGTYTVPTPSNPLNTLKLIVVVSTEDTNSGDHTAQSVSFGGVNMTKVVGQQTNTTYETATAMFYLDVTAGQSGAIAAGWGGITISHQVITVLTLENVQPGGPEIAGVGYRNTGGNVTNGTVATLNDNTMLVLGASMGDTDAVSPTGAGHIINVNNDLTDSSMRGTIGTALIPTAGTVTGLGMSGTANRMSLVIAGFAPASAATPTPTYVRFQGVDMNQISTSQFTGGAGVTGSTLYEMDVVAGASGTIDVEWPSETSERLVTAVTLTDVAAGPIILAQTDNAADESNGATSVGINGVTQGGVMVSFGFQNHTAKVEEMGPSHTLVVDEQTDVSSATWGGMGTVAVLVNGNLSGFGYQGSHTRRAVVMANFAPALVNINTEFTSTGCQPWSDIETLVKMKSRGNVSSPRFAGVVVRSVDINNYYFVKLEHDPDPLRTPAGDPTHYHLSLVKNDGGGEVTVAGPVDIIFNVSTLITPVDHYIRVRVVGDDFKIRWWQPADPANPTADELATAWQIEVTDAGTTVTSGVLGLVSNRQEFLFDNVSAGPPV